MHTNTSIFFAEKKTLMKNFIRFVIVAFAGLVLVGCMEVESLIKVKPDGSGTIQQTVLMSSELVAMMQGMDESSEANSKKGSPLIDEEQLKAAASKMGEGVTFLHAVEHKSDTSEGYIATYSFTDINKISVDQNAGSNAPSQGGEENKKEEAISFIFTKGKTSTLTIKSSAGNAVKAQQEKAATAEKTPAEIAEEEAAQEMAMGMMSQMFKGMRVAMIVEIDGDIVDTNATHRDGQRITIMDMNFEKLLEDEEAFKEFVSSSDQGIENAKEYMKNIPGVKVDMNDELVIKFK